MAYKALNFIEKFNLLNEQWAPKVIAEHEVKMLLIEPRGVLNTGEQGGELTAENDVWI
jgi:hypothetical protein